MPKPSFVTLLATAREILIQRVFDGEAALEVITSLPTDSCDVQTIGAIAHAKLVLLAGYKTPSEAATARFALARLVTLLEQRGRSRFRVVS